MCMHHKLVGREPSSLTEEGTEAARARDWPFRMYVAGESGPEGGGGAI